MHRLAAILILTAGTAFADQPVTGAQPYIFTQAHSGHSQSVQSGAALQVQLPGNPALWRFDSQASKNISFLGASPTFSPGRIPQTEALYNFNFVLTGGEQAIIVIRTDELPPDLEETVPGGVFSLSLDVEF